MKIQGSGPTQKASKTKKSSSSGSSSSDFSAFIETAKEATSAASTEQTQNIAAVDALLMVQETDDPAQRAARGRMRKRSTDVLQELEKVRMAMLSGNLTIGHMIDIADVVSSHRENVHDPALTAIMDEIDLRAQVELAKMRVSLDTKQQNV
jgi:hypothetical protein